MSATRKLARRCCVRGPALVIRQPGLALAMLGEADFIESDWKTLWFWAPRSTREISRHSVPLGCLPGSKRSNREEGRC